MPNELGPLCPHRGSKTNMTTGTGASTVLGAGELFVEYPDTGVGSGASKIKIGDGVTAYSLLPYALGDTSVQEVTYTESTATTVSQALAEAASGSALGNIIAGLKKAVELSSTEISAFDVKYGNSNVGAELNTLNSNLTVSGTNHIRFGIDSNNNYGYYKVGADTVTPFSTLDIKKITVTAANQLLSGYKDYDSNGNLLTGTNAGYDAGVTQGENNMKDGVTLDYDGNHLIQGYKARTSAGVLITGTNKGYDAGVTQGHADRDSGVTVTDPYHILSGYKGRKSNGELVTGTNGGWDAGYSAGRSQGQADRDSGVTITSGAQILSGYSGRTSNGTLVSGSAQTGKQISVANITTKDVSGARDVTFSATVGAVYAVSFGGRDSVPTSAPTISGATNLGYTYGWVDGRGSLGSLLICQATSTSVTITISKREVCAVVTRVTT